MPWESEFNLPHTTGQAKGISEEVRKAVKIGTLLFMRPSDATEYMRQFERATEQVQQLNFRFTLEPFEISIDWLLKYLSFISDSCRLFPPLKL